MNRPRVAISAVLGVVLALLLVIPALAYTYRMQIVVTEADGEAYTALPIILSSVNTQWMIDNGFMRSDGRDTRVATAADTLPHMVTDNSTLVVLDIAASSKTNIYHTCGNSLLDSFPIIVGYGGLVTVAAAEALELGDNFTLEVKGYVDTCADADIIFKQESFSLSTSDANDIIFTIYGSISVTAPNILPGPCTIRVVGDGTNLTIYIDDVWKDSEDMTEVTVPANGYPLLFFQDNVMLYVEYVQIWK